MIFPFFPFSKKVNAPLSSKNVLSCGITVFAVSLMYIKDSRIGVLGSLFHFSFPTFPARNNRIYLYYLDCPGVNFFPQCGHSISLCFFGFPSQLINNASISNSDMSAISSNPKSKPPKSRPYNSCDNRSNCPRRVLRSCYLIAYIFASALLTARL